MTAPLSERDAAVADADELETAMQYTITVNATLIQWGVAILRGHYELAEARTALVAGESAESFAARYVGRALSRCTCGHEYRGHGDITHTCLVVLPGLKRVRCRCKHFVARAS